MTRLHHWLTLKHRPCWREQAQRFNFLNPPLLVCQIDDDERCPVVRESLALYRKSGLGLSSVLTGRNL